jgi:flavin-dependent dehydrogenase
MAASERYQVLVVGSGEAGKYLAWTLSKAGQRTALVERSTPSSPIRPRQKA